MFTQSDTTGEKEIEEFHTELEQINIDRFNTIGIVKNSGERNSDDLNHFLEQIAELKKNNQWKKAELVILIKKLIPEMNYADNGKYLDAKM